MRASEIIIGKDIGMKHIVPDLIFENDPHTHVENPDFAPLDRLYEGRVARYGDYHAHSKSGGTSDGHTTPEEWLIAMKDLKMDFVGLMDHRQVRHMYLDCFDPEYFIYGTEPAAVWKEPKTELHYLMIFKDKESLARDVLERFPENYRFTGGLEGSFRYGSMERSRFIEICDAVRAAGGACVNAHPKQTLVSDRAADYYFGEGSAIETIYTYGGDKQLNEGTIANYRLWMEMLDGDMKVYTTATADVHGKPTNGGINTVYAARKHCEEYVDRLIKGDLNAGYVGIKMSLGGAPVGSTIEYKDGMELLIKVDDPHPLVYKKDEAHRLDVLSDKGLVCSIPLVNHKAEVAIKAEKRRFYRAVVIRESDGAPAAIGNPIWVE